MRLDLANKALNVQPIYQEKNSLTQIINQDKEKLEKLQKELEDLKQLLESTTNESLKSKDELDKEKISFDSNSKKLQEVRTLQTKIESKLQNIKELENKISSQNEQKTKLNEELGKIESVKTKMIKLDWQDEIALANMDALKEELVNMVRKKRDSGKDSFELTPEKANKLHDDRALISIGHFVMKVDKLQIANFL